MELVPEPSLTLTYLEEETSSDDLNDFVEKFKKMRIKLGVTFDVGLALGKTFKYL